MLDDGFATILGFSYSTRFAGPRSHRSQKLRAPFGHAHATKEAASRREVSSHFGECLDDRKRTRLRYRVWVDTRIEQLSVRAERFLVISRSLPHERPELTSAENAVVQLFLQGQTLRAIGLSRGSSVRTVANQVQSVYRKLGVNSRAELVRKLGGAGGET
jgi:DNA-binding NarL/FixJ family response regulator